MSADPQMHVRAGAIVEAMTTADELALITQMQSESPDRYLKLSMFVGATIGASAGHLVLPWVSAFTLDMDADIANAPPEAIAFELERRLFLPAAEELSSEVGPVGVLMISYDVAKLAATTPRARLLRTVAVMVRMSRLYREYLEPVAPEARS